MSLQSSNVSETKSASISSTAKVISHADFSWTAGVLSGADRAIITARTGGVMYRYDGTSPTTTVGHLLHADDTICVIGGNNIQNLSFIRESSTNSTLTITIERA